MKNKKFPTLDSNEEKLWQLAMTDTKPIFLSNKKIDRKRLPIESHEIKKGTKISNNLHIEKVNKKTLNRLGKGLIKIDDKLDMHGMSINSAYQKLENFLIDSRKNNYKCVLIITGKGKKAINSDSLFRRTLKELLPIWISEPNFSRHIIKHSSAKSNHGAEGARYLFLRKNKKL